MAKRRRDHRGSQTTHHAPVAAPSSARLVTPWWTYAVRVWLAGMFAATIQLTWPLWTERTTPPLLPLVPMPAFEHYGVVLVVTAVTFIFWPRAGLAANVLVGLAAMASDQTRMQPQLFSFWLLMLGTLPFAVPQFLGRIHLASLWCFSGFHKLLSPAYYTEVGPFLWTGMFPPAIVASIPEYSKQFACVLALVELLLGVAVLVPRLRRGSAVVAFLLHLSVLWVLHQKGNWNTSVWPWNLALAVAGTTFIYTWKRSLVEEHHACGRAGFFSGVSLFFSPLLFYVGALDPYLCHCLYSANVPKATMIPADRSPAYQLQDFHLGPYWKYLNVPQPPTHRNFELYFRAAAKPGDRMIIDDDRAWAEWAGHRRYGWYHNGTTIERVDVKP